MKKYYLYILVSAITLSLCGEAAAKAKPTAKEMIPADTAKKKEKIYYKDFNRAYIEMMPALFPWFKPNYEAYSTDSNYVKILKPFAGRIRVKVIAGSWCEDTHLELPRFYKMADDIGLRADQIELIGVDRERKDESGKRISEGMIKVPAFYFYLNGNPIGKIIEHPEAKFEIDLTKMVLSVGRKN